MIRFFLIGIAFCERKKSIKFSVLGMELSASESHGELNKIYIKVQEQKWIILKGLKIT